MASKENLFMIMAALFVSGCVMGTLDFTVRYKEVSGLRKGDRVLYEERHIGDVKEVKYTDRGDYLVEMSIRREFTKDATEYSRFYIDSDPERKDRQSVHMFRTDSGGAPIQEGAIIPGTMKHAALYDRFSAKLRNDLQRLEKELDSFVESFRRFPESEQIKQLEEELDRLLGELRYFGDEAKHKLKNEILPRIRDKIEELRRRLKELGREDDLKRVDRKMERLTAEL